MTVSHSGSTFLAVKCSACSPLAKLSSQFWSFLRCCCYAWCSMLPSSSSHIANAVTGCSACISWEDWYLTSSFPWTIQYWGSFSFFLVFFYYYLSLRFRILVQWALLPQYVTNIKSVACLRPSWKDLHRIFITLLVSWLL